MPCVLLQDAARALRGGRRRRSWAADPRPSITNWPAVSAFGPAAFSASSPSRTQSRVHSAAGSSFFSSGSSSGTSSPNSSRRAGSRRQASTENAPLVEHGGHREEMQDALLALVVRKRTPLVEPPQRVIPRAIGDPLRLGAPSRVLRVSQVVLGLLVHELPERVESEGRLPDGIPCRGGFPRPSSPSRVHPAHHHPEQFRRDLPDVAATPAGLPNQRSLRRLRLALLPAPPFPVHSEQLTEPSRILPQKAWQTRLRRPRQRRFETHAPETSHAGAPGPATPDALERTDRRPGRVVCPSRHGIGHISRAALSDARRAMLANLAGKTPR